MGYYEAKYLVSPFNLSISYSVLDVYLVRLPRESTGIVLRQTHPTIIYVNVM